MTVATEISMLVSTAVSALVSTAMSMRVPERSPVPGSSPVSMNAIATGVMAMAVSVAAMTAPAEAGFLYVPPHEAAAAAESGKDRAPTGREAATQRNDRASGPARGNPDEATTRTEEIGAHRREAPRHADAERLARSDSPSLWQVHAGEMLREALGRWAAHAGVELMFLTDRRYRLREGRAFEGSFGEATQGLFAALSHLPHPPAGEMRPCGRTLAVMHRPGGVRPAGDDR